MMFRTLALAGAAMAALTFAAQAADEQDGEVKQLNLEQLEKAKSGDTDAPAATEAPAVPDAEEAAPDGQGGPELQGPPSPDEGMTDEPADDTTATPPPDSEAPADEADEMDEDAPTPPQPE
jgi:hypothetical protein